MKYKENENRGNLFKLPDLDLVKKIKSSDPRAFDIIFGRYYNRLCDTAFYIVKDKQISKDLVHDIFVVFWKNREELNLTISLKSYLHKAVHNKALDYIRHSKVIQKNEEFIKLYYQAEETPYDILNKSELLQTAQKAIDALPEKCRIVFSMSRFDNLTYSEIAEIKKISIKTVETHMSHALKMLRKHLSSFFSLLTV